MDRLGDIVVGARIEPGNLGNSPRPEPSRKAISVRRSESWERISRQVSIPSISGIITSSRIR